LNNKNQRTDKTPWIPNCVVLIWNDLYGSISLMLYWSSNLLFREEQWVSHKIIQYAFRRKVNRCTAFTVHNEVTDYLYNLVKYLYW